MSMYHTVHLLQYIPFVHGKSDFLSFADDINRNVPLSWRFWSESQSSKLLILSFFCFLAAWSACRVNKKKKKSTDSTPQLCVYLYICYFWGFHAHTISSCTVIRESRFPNLPMERCQLKSIVISSSDPLR